MFLSKQHEKSEGNLGYFTIIKQELSSDKQRTICLKISKAKKFFLFKGSWD